MIDSNLSINIIFNSTSTIFKIITNRKDTMGICMINYSNIITTQFN